MQKQSLADEQVILKISTISQKKTSVLKFLFNKVAGLKASNFIKKRLQRSCFPVKFAKFLGISFSTGHLQWLLRDMVALLTLKIYPRRRTTSCNVHTTSYDVVRRRIDLETMLCVYTEVLKTQGQISKKTSVLKSTVRVITHVIFQLCRVYPAGVIWKNKNWRQIFKQTKSTFEQIFFEKRTYSTYVITVWFSEYLKKIVHSSISSFAFCLCWAAHVIFII